MKALILAAGYGTRLYPLTLDRPKALLEVGGKSILARHLEKLEKIGSCDGVYIVTNARFYDGVAKWLSSRRFRFPVGVINDMTTSNDDRLGAIGDIDLVLGMKKPQDDLLIMAGDNLFEFNLADFLSFSAEKGRMCIALYDVNDRNLAKRYGIVGIDGNSKVVKFQEKPAEPESTLASTGIYFLPVSRVGKITEYMKTANPKDAPGNFVKWMAETDGVYGFVFTEGWYDIGDVSSLKKADEEYRRKGL